VRAVTAGGCAVVEMSSGEGAVGRARWLAELSAALDEARRLTKALGADEGRIEAVELYARIEAVRLEIHAMRLARMSFGANFDPEWTKDIPWKRSA
jgi:hypothetical protein